MNKEEKREKDKRVLGPAIVITIMIYNNLRREDQSNTKKKQELLYKTGSKQRHTEYKV